MMPEWSAFRAEISGSTSAALLVGEPARAWKPVIVFRVVGRDEMNSLINHESDSGTQCERDL